MKDSVNKKGQITLFVIIAIVIVLSISLIYITNKKSTSQISPSEDPRGYMEDCIGPALEKAELEIIPHGGFANPSDSVKFDTIDVVWLCHTPGTETLCTNKHPMLKAEMEKEITNLIKPKIEQCFNDLQLQLKKYDYTEGELNISTEILLGKVKANVDKKITFSKNELTITLNNFDSSINSPLYYFDKLARDIVNQEVTCNCLEESCNADLIKMNRFNRDFEITKPVYGGNGQEIYTIKEILTGKQFNFAVRNCVRLP